MLGQHAIRRAAVAAVLYAVGVAGLLWRIGDHPPFPYNWESYTAWNFWSYWAGPVPDLTGILAVTDGLMTDSGRGPLLGLPIWFGFRLDGVGLTQLRWPATLVTALAVPLTWAVGRRLSTPPVAVLAALLLAMSPVFLFYGRTATLVGISMVPALLTILTLAGLLEAAPTRRAAVWLVGLQLCLVLGIFAYAPVRLLWPLACAVVLGAAVAWPDRRRLLGTAFLVSLLVVPSALIALHGWTVGTWSLEPVLGYFQVRGEQIFELADQPARYLPYLRDAPPATSDPVRLAWGLISQNLGDAMRLLLDWQTAPVVTDFWSPRGQLWSWLLAPFFWLGIAGLLAALRGGSWRRWLWLWLLLGLTGPLLLTTRVHVGRLVPALPLLLLTVAWGVSVVVDLGARLRAGRGHEAAGSLRWGLMVGLSALAVTGSAMMTLSSYRHLPTEVPESRLTAQLAELVGEVAEHGGGALVFPASLGLEVEGVRAGTLWLALDRTYRFVDLSRGPEEPVAGDDRPSLAVVGVIPRLLDGALPNLCHNLYLVMPDAAAEFHALESSRDVRERCPAGLDSRLLLD